MRRFRSNNRTILKNKAFDGGKADQKNWIILPQGTTEELAALPDMIGSIAYDTTLDQVVIDNGSGFAPVDAGGGGGSEILAFTSDPSPGGSAEEALSVPGLLATDTILSVSLKVYSGYSIVLAGWTTVADNLLTVQWTDSVQPGAIVVVAVKR